MSWMDDWERGKEDREDAFTQARTRPCPDPDVHRAHVYRQHDRSWQCEGRTVSAPGGA